MEVGKSMISLFEKVDWLNQGIIRPYVFVREENQIAHPGTLHKLNWFSQHALIKNPLHLSELDFANAIYYIEERAFGPANMAMPRWVFYDCAVIPGFVAGFAAHYNSLNPEIQELMKPFSHLEWVPLSLFIIIPTMHKGEWVAHNLCSVNSLLSKASQLYGLGFLSKAFGLWYANVAQCSGVTQWGSPALKLHSHYGHLELLGSYAPVHSIARTVTYRVQVNPQVWELFFTKEEDYSFLENYEKSGALLDPTSEVSMIALQNKIQNKEGPFYLSANEIGRKGLKEPLEIYRKKMG